MLRKCVVCFIAAFFFTVRAFAAEFPKIPEFKCPTLSVSSEIKRGEEFAREFESAETVIRDYSIERYLGGLAMRLASAETARNLGFEFRARVVKSEKVNAFSSPGGFLYVTSALLEKVEKEDQLAGTMAHEVSHVLLRHGTCGQALWERLVYSVQMRAIDIDVGLYFDEVVEIVRWVYGEEILRFSREQELEADRLSVNLLEARGFDSIAYVGFFRRTSSDGGSEHYSSHPLIGKRVGAMMEVWNIQQFGAPALVQRQDSGVNFSEMKQRLAEIASSE